MKQPCDFCGAPVEWTEHQKALDAQLRVLGNGLGVMCDACDDKQVAALIADFARGEDDDDD